MDENDTGDGKGTLSHGRREVGDPDGSGQATGSPVSNDPWAMDEMDPAGLEKAEFSPMFSEFHDRAGRLGLSGNPDTVHDHTGEKAPEAAGSHLLNRNLSESVRAIRDHGPATRSASHATPTPPSPGDAGMPGSGGDAGWEGPKASLAGMAAALAPGHAGYWRLLMIAMVILVLIGFTIWGKENLSVNRQAGSVNRAPEIRINDEPEANPPAAAVLDQLRERQQEIITRQELLMRDIADFKLAINANEETKAASLAATLEQQRLQMKALNEKVSGLQAHIAGLELPFSSLPAPAAGPKRPDKAGGWVVNLAAFSDENAGRNMLATLQKAGIRAEQRPVTVDGATRYRLLVAGFDSRADALQYIKALPAEYGIKGAWAALE